jgi:hypothetical protein
MQSIHAGAYDPRLPAGIMMPPKGGWSAGLASTAATEPSTRTQSPIVTGTGVIGVKYNGGVMIAADCLGTSSRSTAERPGSRRGCESFDAAHACLRDTACKEITRVMEKGSGGVGAAALLIFGGSPLLAWKGR